MKKGRLAFMMLTALLAVPACGGSGGGEPESAVTIDQKTLDLVVGQSVQLTATAPEEETLSWTSSDPTIVSVDENGKVTGEAIGNATITVKIVGSADKATCQVTVKGVPEDALIKTATEINIKTTFNDSFGQHFIDAAERVMKKEPLLTINYTKFGGTYEALKTNIVNGVPAGDYPDITVAYPDSVADFINAGVALDIEPYMDDPDIGWTEDEKDDFYTAYLDEGRNYSIPGTLSLPIAKSTEGMYYDSEKILGITLPGVNNNNPLTEQYINNLTWDELFDVLCPALLKYRETLPEKDRKAFLDQETYSDWAVVGYDSDDNLFITLAEQYGYGYTSVDQVTGAGSIEFDNANMKALMAKFHDAYTKKYFTTKGVIGTNVNNRSNDDAMLFSIGSTGGVTYQFKSANPKNMKVARIPQAPGKDAKVIQQGPSVSFLNHFDDNRALASWLFYKELTTVQGCLDWATSTGYAPIRESVAFEDAFLEYSDETRWDPKTLDHLKALNAQFQNKVSNDLFVSPVFKGSSEARTQVGGLMTSCLVKEPSEYDGLFTTAVEAIILKM